MELLTVQETAALLRVTPTTVRRFISAGRLPAVRVGRGVRVSMDSVADFLTPVSLTPPSTNDLGNGGSVIDVQHAAARQLSDEDKLAVLAAIELAGQERRALAEKYKHVALPSALDLLDEARSQRDRELS